MDWHTSTIKPEPRYFEWVALRAHRKMGRKPLTAEQRAARCAKKLLDAEERRQRRLALKQHTKQALASTALSFTPGASCERDFDKLLTQVIHLVDCGRDPNVPLSYVAADGTPVGRTLYHMRCHQAYLKGHPDQASRRAQLELLGVDLSRMTKDEERWQTFQRAVLRYKSEHGTASVPALYRTPDGYRLGATVNGIRAKGTMLASSPHEFERRAWLQSTGVPRSGVNKSETWTTRPPTCMAANR